MKPGSSSKGMSKGKSGKAMPKESMKTEKKGKTMKPMTKSTKKTKPDMKKKGAKMPMSGYS